MLVYFLGLVLIVLGFLSLIIYATLNYFYMQYVEDLYWAVQDQEWKYSQSQRSLGNFQTRSEVYEEVKQTKEAYQHAESMNNNNPTPKILIIIGKILVLGGVLLILIKAFI